MDDWFEKAGAAENTIFVLHDWGAALGFYRACCFPPTPLRTSRQKVNKKTPALSKILDQMDMMYLYRTVHPNSINSHLLKEKYCSQG